MKRWLPLSLLVFAIGMPPAFGNVGPQPGDKGFVWPPAVPLPGREVKLVVKVDEKAKTPQLQIPVNLLNPAAVPAAPPERGGDARRSALPTVVAGLALTLAFASGGLWLVRRGARRTLAILVVTELVAAGTVALWANAPYQPSISWQKPSRQKSLASLVKPAQAPLKLPAGIELSDQLILEPMPPGDHLTLIVPKSMVLEKKKEAAPREKRDR